MAVKPVGVPQKNGSSFAGEEGKVTVLFPTGVVNTQVVLCYTNIAFSGPAEGTPVYTFSEPGWVKLTEGYVGIRGCATFIKVFNGPIPVSAELTFKWKGATTIFWGFGTAAYDEVNPSNPVDVSNSTRVAGATEIPLQSVTATAKGVGGRLVNAISPNSGTVTHSSKEGVQENVLPGPGRSIWQDPTLIAAPGATGTRTIILSEASESFGASVLLTAGPAAPSGGKPAFVPTNEGYAYFNSER